MNTKITQAMEENKIFQIKDKFFRKTENGDLQEMQQVKTEEIVSKGSRKFLRTTMKFIPKQIYIGNKSSSLPMPKAKTESIKSPISLNQPESLRKATGNSEMISFSNEASKNSEVYKKTMLPENISVGSNTKEMEDNRTSLKITEKGVKVSEREENKEEKGKEGLLKEHGEWFKSAQSIYQNEKIPSKVEGKMEQEVIQEVETDLQYRDSQSSGDALFDNLNEVYGEKNEREVNDYYEYRDDQGESTEKGSYVQVPTRSEQVGLIQMEKFSFPRKFEYEGKRFFLSLIWDY
jgi:hypothetical protein